MRSNFAYSHSFMNHLFSFLLWFLFGFFFFFVCVDDKRFMYVQTTFHNWLKITFYSLPDTTWLWSFSLSLLLYAYHFMLRFLVSSILCSFWHICHIRHTHSADLLNEWRRRRLPTTAQHEKLSKGQLWEKDLYYIYDLNKFVKLIQMVHMDLIVHNLIFIRACISWW